MGERTASINANNNGALAGGEPVKVYLRLRPMDKLETSKRSKDCIELHDNPKVISVDSPLLGSFNFTFDTVFDEYTPQQEVFKESLSNTATRLVHDGIPCAVLAYGQTGTGKTHTMLGEGLGVEMNVRANPQSSFSTVTSATQSASSASSPNPNNNPNNNINSTTNDELDPRKNPSATEGMIPRVVAHAFRLLEKLPKNLEFTVRCSYVELYLEKFCDLLQPWRDDIRIGKDDYGDACIVGASELCCLEALDVYALLARGNAFRTKAATDHNTDSSRSHAIFTMRIGKIDVDTGKQVSTRLLMFDLAGSEVGKSKSTRKETAVGLESRMINASLSSVQNLIRSTLAQQGKEKAVQGAAQRVNPSRASSAVASKLAKLLQPCFGSSWFTTIICTGSPSSYNINETINTIRFGQQARLVTNTPVPRESLTISAYRARMTESERRQENLTSLVKMLAHECKHVKGRSKGKDSGNVPLWEAIDKIVDAGEPEDHDFKIRVAIRNPGEASAGSGGGSPNDGEENIHLLAKIALLEQEAAEHKAAREKAENGMRDVRSEFTSLRSQREFLTNEKLKLEQEVSDAKDEIKSLTTRVTDLEHHLRTSQFREKEAILFLRQFRTFYLRLLRNKAAHGSGTTKDLTSDVSTKIPGVSDLADLIDVDKLMVESGIIEDGEVGKDTNAPDYYPSKEALERSDDAAEKADSKEIDMIREMQGMKLKPTSGRISIRNSTPTNEFTFGQLTNYRQKLLETPAGRLAIKKETELENDLLEMGKKVVTLQNSLIAERAMVEALSSRQGAMSKMKAAQELNTVKQELERKTNDLHAIVWKMNELHLVNKTIETKVENREQHVNYLEEHLVDLQGRNRRLVIDRQEAEKRLLYENSNLRNQVDGLAARVWQLGTEDGLLPPWRLVLPYRGEKVNLSMMEEVKKRLSLGNLEDEVIDGIVQVVEVNEK